MPAKYIIVGNGAAGLSAAETIRAVDAQADITILSDEPHPYYSRPSLAYYLAKDIPQAQVFARPADHYEELNIKLVPQRATSISARDHRITLADGRQMSYDALLLATGSRAIPAPFANGRLQGVVYLDSLDTTNEIVRLSRRAKVAVVVGGGVTALELVEGLHQRGLHVHYLMRRERFWSRLLTPAESQIIENRLEEMGVDIHRQETVEAAVGSRKVEGVRLASGKELGCQIIGVAVGVRPNIALARDAGLRCDRGVLVDEYLRSSDPDIYAAGDIAQIYDRWSGRPLCDSLWSSAILSGRAAGANMAGAQQPYEKPVPFNVARLCGIMVTIVGQVSAQTRDTDTTIEELGRGSSQVWNVLPFSNIISISRQRPQEARRLILRNNILVGAILIGDQRLSTPVRELIQAGADLSPILPQLQDPERSVTETLLTFWQQWKESSHEQDPRQHT